MIEQTCPESPILSGWPDHSNWDIKLLICGKSPIEFRVQGNSREKKIAPSRMVVKNKHSSPRHWCQSDFDSFCFFSSGGFGATSSQANANAFNQQFGPQGFGASAANAGAQSFYNQGPGGGFGASAANAASQGFQAGPGGFSVGWIPLCWKK